LSTFHLCSDEGFIEPPSKKAKSDAASPVVVASEASAPKAAPMAQASTASSLSKGKDVSPTAATATPPSVSLFLIVMQISWSVLCLTISGKTSFFLKDLRGVISSLEAFASQFTSLEADKARLQEEVKSSSLKLDGAVKIAAEARQEVDSLKVELGKLKEKLKEEEASRLVAEARAAEKDEVLRQSSLALLGNFYTPLSIDVLMDSILLPMYFFPFFSLQKRRISLLMPWTEFQTTLQQMLCR
jgi:hypothetical protein